MERARKVREMAEKIIEKGSKPSAARISSELDMPDQDVHRCLNHLEKKGEISTYTREFMGSKLRMVGVNR